MELKTFTQFSALLSLLALSVAALPVEVPSVAITSDLHRLAHREADIKPAANRPSKLEEESVTDQYLFNITLESFVHERECQCSPYLFWESDGCSDSPDHPFGFDYLPACYRHDFGYDNYKRVCYTSSIISFIPPLTVVSCSKADLLRATRKNWI